MRPPPDGWVTGAGCGREGALCGAEGLDGLLCGALGREGLLWGALGREGLLCGALGREAGALPPPLLPPDEGLEPPPPPPPWLPGFWPSAAIASAEKAPRASRESSQIRECEAIGDLQRVNDRPANEMP